MYVGHLLDVGYFSVQHNREKVVFQLQTKVKKNLFSSTSSYFIVSTNTQLITTSAPHGGVDAIEEPARCTIT